jgi:uncharacterized protein Usg
MVLYWQSRLMLFELNKAIALKYVNRLINLFTNKAYKYVLQETGIERYWFPFMLNITKFFHIQFNSILYCVIYGHRSLHKQKTLQNINVDMLYAYMNNFT